MKRSWHERFKGIRNMLSGLRLLANPALLRALGNRVDELTAIQRLRHANPTCYLDDEIVFYDEPTKVLRLGARVRIARGAVFGSQTLTDEPPPVIIGENTYLGEYSNVRTAPGTNVFIGANVLIAQFCSIVSANHRTEPGAVIADQGIALHRHSVVIEDGVWLGAGTTVLPGVTIGEGAVIGANSVVSSDVPSNEIWAGSPARRLRMRGEK